MSGGQDLTAREGRFHDGWASSERPEDVDVRAAFEAPTALENRFILGRIGSLDGKRLLDVGAGLGDTSVYLSRRGARVVSLDASHGMASFARRLAAHHAVGLLPTVASAESLPFGSSTFDVVYAANLMHHLQDRDRFLAEVHRVLKPGGWFFAYDPLAYNPAIDVYRRLASEVRTADERPLRFPDLERARRFFAEVGHREFWITALVLFVKYYAVDRVDPNADRYWRRILREPPERLWWWFPLARLDVLLARLPLLRRMAWNTVLWARKGPG